MCFVLGEFIMIVGLIRVYLLMFDGELYYVFFFDFVIYFGLLVKVMKNVVVMVVV